MEVGSHSPRISRFFRGLDHEVLVANPRKMRGIFKNDRKCDLYDARMLAKIARFDRSMLHPIEHQGEEAHRDLLQIKIRDSLVRRPTARPPSGHVAFAPVHPAPRYCRCVARSKAWALRSKARTPSISPVMRVATWPGTGSTPIRVNLAVTRYESIPYDRINRFLSWLGEQGGKLGVLNTPLTARSRFSIPRLDEIVVLRSSQWATRQFRPPPRHRTRPDDRQGNSRARP